MHPRPTKLEQYGDVRRSGSPLAHCRFAPLPPTFSGKARRSKRRSIPIRTFADWNNPAPGYMEADLVAHSGGSMAGSMVHSFVLTDVATGWTEYIALLARDQTMIVDALSRLRDRLPFPLFGLDTDNDAVFINETVLGYCRQNAIEFTRSRAYRKNDQAWIEQKNGSVVRKLVGYGRLEGMTATDALANLYEASRLYVNFYQPSFKLKSKTREGARVTKCYHAPATPYQRLIDTASIPESIKEQLRVQFLSLDPIRLLGRIRHAQSCLVALEGNASGTNVHTDQTTLIPSRLNPSESNAPLWPVCERLGERERFVLLIKSGPGHLETGARAVIRLKPPGLC